MGKLEIIMLSDISHIEKAKCHIFLSYWNLDLNNVDEHKSRTTDGKKAGGSGESAGKGRHV
jgi:hypothetical protein